MNVFGYARVLHEKKSFSSQIRILKMAGCTEIIKEVSCGSGDNQKELNILICRAAREDRLVVSSLDVISWSISGLVKAVSKIERNGAVFISMKEGINTDNKNGIKIVDSLRFIERFERASAIEAKRKLILEINKEKSESLSNLEGFMLDNHSKFKVESHKNKIFQSGEYWIYYIYKLRPHLPWGDVRKVINDSAPDDDKWTMKRLQLAARYCVQEGTLPKSIFGYAFRTSYENKIRIIISSIRHAEPHLCPADIFGKLERIENNNTNKNFEWSPEEVENFINHIE